MRQGAPSVQFQNIRPICMCVIKKKKKNVPCFRKQVALISQSLSENIPRFVCYSRGALHGLSIIDLGKSMKFDPPEGCLHIICSAKSRVYAQRQAREREQKIIRSPIRTCHRYARSERTPDRLIPFRRSANLLYIYMHINISSQTQITEFLQQKTGL